MDLSQEIRNRFTQHADDNALEVNGVWHSWGEVHAIAQRIDQALDHAGVGPTSPVGIIGRNRLTHMAAMLAMFGRSRTTVCIYSLLPPDGLAAEIKKLNLQAIIADRSDWQSPIVVEATRSTGTVAVSIADKGASDQAAEVTLVPGLEKVGAGPHRPETPDVAIEILTSGTTGLPKRVPIAWHTVNLAMGDAKKVIVQNYHKAAKSDSAPPIRIHYVPLGNMSGIWTLLATVLDGSPMVVFEKFDVPRWTDTIRKYRPHYIGLVPAAVKMVLDADVPVEALSSVTVLNMGGAKLDPKLQQLFEKKYDIMILSSYGATEFFGAIAAWSLDDRRKYGDSKFGSTGRVRPGVNLRIVHPESRATLAHGEIGLLDVQIERAGPEWIQTTDLASLDEDGFLYIHGRADGAISRGGFKMHPQEISEVLCQHPSIAEAAVVGIPDERLGEVPAAAVELVPGAEPVTTTELEAFARKHLVPYKVPARFAIVDKLPRTLSLKVSVPDVRALFTIDA